VDLGDRIHSTAAVLIRRVCRSLQLLGIEASENWALSYRSSRAIRLEVALALEALCFLRVREKRQCAGSKGGTPPCEFGFDLSASRLIGSGGVAGTPGGHGTGAEEQQCLGQTAADLSTARRPLPIGKGLFTQRYR